jgi:parallel beta-helix repeat protein
MEDYALLSVMGDGGQGQVFKARHIRTGDLAAVKVMRCRDQREVNTALKEVKVLIQLRHEHIVSYTDFLLHFDQFGPLTLSADGTAPSARAPLPPSGIAKLVRHPAPPPPPTAIAIPAALVNVCLVMELCTEGTVCDKVREATSDFMVSGKNPIDEVRVIKWLRQCAEALQFIHRHGFLHRDLKPTNVFFHNDDVRLGDFGVATTAQEGRMTQAGTPYYFAPELLQLKPYDAKVDVWGLGITFFELCTLGERALNRQVLQDPTAIKAVEEDVVYMGFSAELARLIASMLHADPAARPTPGQVMATIDRWTGKAQRPLAPGARLDGIGTPTDEVMLDAAAPTHVRADSPLASSSSPSPGDIDAPCDLCGIFAGTVRCLDCGNESYCAGCDEVKHRNSTRRSHTRTSVGSGDVPRVPAQPFPVAPVVPFGEHRSQNIPPSKAQVKASGDPVGTEPARAFAPSAPALPRPVALPPAGAMEVRDPPSTAQSRGTSPVQPPTFPLPTPPTAAQPAARPPSSPDHVLYVPSKAFPTLSSALAAATPGVTVSVSAGTSHQTPVVLSVPGVALVGEGTGDSRPRLGDGHMVTITVTAAGCTVSNFIVRQTVPPTEAPDRPFGILVAVPNGSGPAAVVLEKCDITSAGNGIGVQGPAVDVQVSKCSVTRCKQAGIYVHAGGQCTVTRSTISRCEYAGVLVKKSTCRILNCEVRDCSQTGVFYHEGDGLVEGNMIADNGGCGVVLKASATATLRRNTVEGSGQAGVFCCDRCAGSISDNTITGSSKAGVIIKTEAHPTVMRNVIANGRETGIYVFERGQGHIEANDIRQNANAGILVTTLGDPRVVNNRIHSNQFEGVWVCKQGGGYFEGNDLRRNGKGAKDFSTCTETVRWLANREDSMAN